LIVDGQSLHQLEPAYLVRMWVSITSDAACAAALEQAVEDYGIVDTERRCKLYCTTMRLALLVRCARRCRQSRHRQLRSAQ